MELKKRLRMKSGETVIDRQRSHLHGEISQLLSEILSKIESNGRDYVREEVDLGRIVGKTTRITTCQSDEIVYAKRIGRFGYSRFVKDRQPEETSKVSVILKLAADIENTYVLIAAFIGTMAPPEPWDKNSFSKERNPQKAQEEAKNFWSSQALIWGTEEVIPGTEIIQCPW